MGKLELDVYNVNDIAEALHITPRTVLNYLRSGRLKGAKIGGKWLVTRENLLELINGNTQSSANGSRRKATK